MYTCTMCGKLTKYKNKCRSCIAKELRAKQKADPELSKRYHERMSKIIKERHKDGTFKGVNIKIKETLKKFNESLGTEGRKKLYNPYKYLTDEQKNHLIKICTDRGFIGWWKKASKEEKIIVYDKRRKSLVNTWDIRGSEILNKMHNILCLEHLN